MLKINCKNGVNMVRAEGTAADVVADLCISIGKIHMGFMQHNPELAKSFQLAIMQGVSPISPIWRMKQHPDEVMAVKTNETK